MENDKACFACCISYWNHVLELVNAELTSRGLQTAPKREALDRIKNPGDLFYLNLSGLSRHTSGIASVIPRTFSHPNLFSITSLTPPALQCTQTWALFSGMTQMAGLTSRSARVYVSHRDRDTISQCG